MVVCSPLSRPLNRWMRTRRGSGSVRGNESLGMCGIQFPQDFPALLMGIVFAFGGGGKVHLFCPHDRESSLQAGAYCAVLQPRILDLVIPISDVDERYAKSAALWKRRKVSEKAGLGGRLRWRGGQGSVRRNFRRRDGGRRTSGCCIYRRRMESRGIWERQKGDDLVFIERLTSKYGRGC